MPTLQETFDDVVEGLIAQGRPSRTPNGGRCCYRTSNGLKCAVGLLIPDKEYEERWDDSTEATGFDELPELRALMRKLGHDVDLLSDLQEAHDSWIPSDEESFRESFGAVANRFRLNYNGRAPKSGKTS